MKEILEIPNNCGFCKNCFKLRRAGSTYCGKCEGTRMPVYLDEQVNFPLLKEAREKFPIDTNTIFTYGDTIYGRNLDYGLVSHELTHVTRQIMAGEKEWWDKYLNDTKFRVKEEILAYKNQYYAYKRNDPFLAKTALGQIGILMSGPLYQGNISKEDVIRLILEK